MIETNIRNCPWGYSCKQKWEDLTQTRSVNIRFCGECQKEVFWIDDREDLIESIVLNRCICFSPELLRDELPFVSGETRLLGSYRPPSGGKPMPPPIDDHDDDIAF